jgi:hypothetical protein
MRKLLGGEEAAADGGLHDEGRLIIGGGMAIELWLWLLLLVLRSCRARSRRWTFMCPPSACAELKLRRQKLQL